MIFLIGEAGLHFQVEILCQSNIVFCVLMTRGFDDEFIGKDGIFFGKGESE